jgi:hypothetical protein
MAGPSTPYVYSRFKDVDARDKPGHDHFNAWWETSGYLHSIFLTS